MQNPQNLIWIDLEMTGLDPDSDVIIEMATIVTDSELNTLAEGPVIAIHHSDEVLARMDEWNTRTHGASGLTQRVRESKVSMAEAEAQTIAFLEQWVPKGKSPICGNSICQDRRFLYRHMRNLENYFHYRNLDVSTLKELAARWAPGVRDSFKKGNTHLALDDIRESIAELRHYREHFIKL
ncbi:oligoribonuclease [Pseudomonas putida]|uniref:oligoribonuclease n=1 Tax=Pseudomonas putida TaxID=303 RepID=UPI0027766FC0|nr:oligoribonuclease [Pseudomonas putida]EKT4485098.1 oligoribonuclease [Pseudomonas putida]MDP9522504.1 oligoribonuclease [Pseudomonas putida]